MAQSAPYSYDIIKPDQIRLLKFLDDEDHTSAILETFSLDQPLVSYHALSYTWALDEISFTKPLVINIRGRELPILESLRHFIQTLRDKNILLDGRWWWIDSICIDQTNHEERAQQVQNMHQIYRMSSETIVWLGAKSGDSDLAIDFIEYLYELYRNYHSVMETRRLLETDHYRPHWAAIKKLLARRWWSRIWTIQELVVPTRLSFWCGNREVGRTAMCEGIGMTDDCSGVGIKETLGFTHGFNRRRICNLHEAGQQPGASLNLPLVALTSYFACMDTIDDRDRLYGLMAVSTDSFLVDVSYIHRSQEVFLRFAQNFIQRKKSLDIICFASTYRAPSHASQPSWVPHWQKIERTLVMPSMVSQSSKTHIGNLRPPWALECDSTLYYAASKHRDAIYEFRGASLLVHGVIIDIVDGIAGSRTTEMIQSTEWNSMVSVDGTDIYSPTKILSSVCKCLVLDRKDRYLRFPMPTAEFFRDFIYLCKGLIENSDQTIPQELREWLEWIRSLQIFGHTFENIYRDSLQADQDLLDPKFTPNQDEHVNDSFFGRFYDIVVRWSFRLITTCNERIGMGTERVMKGDMICILFGCSIPVILRRSKLEDSFIFIGECFVDGCMDGSVLDNYLDLERTFCIQ